MNRCPVGAIAPHGAVLALATAFAILVFPSVAATAEPPAANAAAEQQQTERSGAKLITPAAQQAIDRGLSWLVARQHEDGSFGAGAYRGNTAVTGIAGMALVAGGSTPGRGPHGLQVQRTVDSLLASAQPSGFITSAAAGHGPMYGHGFATMFLAECYGMSPRAELREKLAKAVKLIVNTQNQDGGWRYMPQRAEADISVTVCEIMALRAARNAGLHVPNQTVDRSKDYVKRCQNADGGFMYMIQGGESMFPRSAAGVVALYSAGVYQDPDITKGLAYLLQFLPAEGMARREAYYYYGHYYAVQAAWHAGGDTWDRWYPAVRDELLQRQRSDGSWPSPIDVDCDTAFALIVLQMPNNYAPIFQR